MDASTATPEIGELPRSFGRFVLFEHIGRGGMADIFLAQMSTSLGGSRNVVVKQILPKLSADPGFSDMLIAEAKLAAKLNHANVVQVFDLGRESERLFIGMEYVEGFDLNQMLRALSRAKRPLPAEFAILIVRETLKALGYAHRAKDDNGKELGIVHRDVSPSNVLISFEGEVKLCDFGIARAYGGELDESQVQRARVAGKVAYMSPEHARGETIDARADVFAAGILLWELCAGRRMYRGSEDEMFDAAKNAQIPELPSRGMPEEERLREILAKALAPNKEDRFTSADEFLEALEEYAIPNRLMASAIRFGSFLEDGFAEEILKARRERQQSAEDLAQALPENASGPSSAPPSSSPFEVSVPKAAPIPKEAKAIVEENVPEESREPSTSEPDADKNIPAKKTDTRNESKPNADKPLVEPFSPLWFALLVLAALLVGASAYVLAK